MKRNRSKLGVDYTGGLKEESTAFAGVGLLVEVYRQLGASEAAEQALPKKRSLKGLKQGEMVESFVVLSALGGECLDDMVRLREDEGLAILLGYKPPAPETARQWLDRFHEEQLMAERPARGSFLPAESSGLAGLREVNNRVVRAYVQGNKPGKDVTLDVDAHLVETSKADGRGAACCVPTRDTKPISRWWCVGRRRDWCSETSFGKGTCPPPRISGG